MVRISNSYEINFIFSYNVHRETERSIINGESHLFLKFVYEITLSFRPFIPLDSDLPFSSFFEVLLPCRASFELSAQTDSDRINDPLLITCQYEVQ